MIGVILAAGMASRLRPLTDHKPKCLLEIGGRTLLERTVEAMRMAGIVEFVVVTGYLGEQVRGFLEQYEARNPGLEFHFLHNADYAHNNNIYSLWMAGQVVRGREFLLMDSDILCDPAAVLAVASHSGSCLALNRHEVGEEEIKVVVDHAGRIVQINKTCNPADAIGESVGIEKMTEDYSAALYDELDQMIERENLIDVFYERAFERLIPQGQTFQVLDISAYYSCELDTPEDFRLARDSWPLG